MSGCWIVERPIKSGGGAPLLLGVRGPGYSAHGLEGCMKFADVDSAHCFKDFANHSGLPVLEGQEARLVVRAVQEG